MISKNARYVLQEPLSVLQSWVYKAVFHGTIVKCMLEAGFIVLLLHCIEWTRLNHSQG